MLSNQSKILLILVVILVLIGVYLVASPKLLQGTLDYFADYEQVVNVESLDQSAVKELNQKYLKEINQAVSDEDFAKANRKYEEDMIKSFY